MSSKKCRRRVGFVRDWPGPLLAWVAGGVDAIGYVTLANLFTAHMSGNTASMGAHFGQGQWTEGVRRGFPIPMFIAGVLLGSAAESLVRLWALILPLLGLLAFAAWRPAGTGGMAPQDDKGR